MKFLKESIEDDYNEWLKDTITLTYDIHLDDVPYGAVHDYDYYEEPYRDTTSVDIDWDYDITVEDALYVMESYFPDEILELPEEELYEWEMKHFDEYFEKYKDKIMDHYEDWAEDNARENYDYDEYHDGFDEGLKRPIVEDLDTQTADFTDKLFDTIMGNHSWALLPDLFGDSVEYPNEVDKTKGIIRINYKGNYYELSVRKLGAVNSYPIREDLEPAPLLDAEEGGTIIDDIDISDDEAEELELLANNVIKEQNKTIVNVESSGDTQVNVESEGSTNLNVSVNVDEDEPIVDYVNENISQTAEIKGEQK